ncbi:hypothetical protein F511_36523 [Dorcoceras hygrometricum]|uniref:Uncharacterized protein n=1 Tax=Dorcoceras hygrometricum TaxID=472368 RepID=A0A2Z7DAP4_9LAMI|nr:hypothetical protein F511_36523 [Dorcoceras hygrometricum]
MGATHSSQHTAPDAKHSSTRCCPTHDMWATPLIVANKSQQGDEVYGSYPLVLNRHPAASIITHAQSKAVKQAHIYTSIIQSYNYNKAVPSNTDLTRAKPNIDTISGTAAQKLRIGSYKLNKICTTLLTQQKALRLEKGDIFAHLSSFTQASKNSTKRSILARGVNRYHSYFSRGYLSSEIGEDKVGRTVDRDLYKSDSFAKHTNSKLAHPDLLAQI